MMVPDNIENVEFHQDRLNDTLVTTNLSWPLRFLFGLNGATLALPSTALMYVANTRVGIPIVYLPIYGALSFLPNSLKPLYAYMSDGWFSRRDYLLFGLLLLSGVTIAATAWVTNFTSCIIMAILREIFSAWPELLLGITLLENGHAVVAATNAKMSTTTVPNPHLTSTLARFQAQAATSRNVGSWISTWIGFLFFWYRQFYSQDPNKPLNDAVVNLILYSTGSLNIIGSIVAWYWRVGYSPKTYSSLEHTPISPSTEEDFMTVNSQCNTVGWGDGIILLQLQALVILMCIRVPIESLISSIGWTVIIGCLLTLFLITIIKTPRNRNYNAGIFLVIRHSIPDSGFLMSSYTYELFQSTPMILSLLGIISGGMSTLSSWSYGKLLTPYSSGKSFYYVIAGTTLMAAFISLFYILVANLDKNSSPWTKFAIFVPILMVSTFIQEWSFMPSVILATTSVSEDHQVTRRCDEPTNDVESRLSPTSVSYQRQRCAPCCKNQESVASFGMQYGALISCLDFGDQIGSWLTMPLVAVLGISRENGWQNLNTFIWITALLSLVPLMFLPLLRNH
jgi:hypothetical protein